MKHQSGLKLRPIRCLSEDCSKLFKFITRHEPWLKSAYKNLLEELPVAPTCRSFIEDKSLRPMGHSRAFYIKGETGSVLGVKGSEPFSCDYPEALDNLSNQTFPGEIISVADFFVLREHKIPLAMSFTEGFQDYASALQLQVSYFEKYGELAHIPTPLALYQIRGKHISRFIETLSTKLSVRANKAVAALKNEGLSAFIYHYPNPPIRVQHIEHRLSQLQPRDGFVGRKIAIEKRTDLKVTVENWIKLWVRIHALGFSPVTLSNNAVGQMIRSQNAVIDGGFVDVDSLQKLDSITCIKVFHQTILASIIELTDTIDMFLIGKLGQSPTSYHPSPTRLLLLRHVLDQIRKLMKKEERNGVVFDPRLRKTLIEKSSWIFLMNTLSDLYPPYMRFEGEKLVT